MFHTYFYYIFILHSKSFSIKIIFKNSLKNYFRCDALLDHVQHSDLDGTDVRNVNSRLIRHPFSIAIHEQWMYITDWRLDAIIRMHKETGEQESILVREPATNRLYGVKVFSREIQNPQAHPNKHPCSITNGGCEKLCFAVPKNQTNKNDPIRLNRVCGCPYGEKLQEDGNEKNSST